MFERQHQRRPSKSDIKCAPPEIYKCYKDYMSIKKRDSHQLLGVDVFGSELNKPKEIVYESSTTENFVSKIPNLRKNVGTKKLSNLAITEQQQDCKTDLLKDLGFYEPIHIADSLSTKLTLPIKTKSCFSKRSSNVMKNLEKHEDIGDSELTDSNKENMSHDENAFDEASSFSKATVLPKENLVSMQHNYESEDPFELNDDSVNNDFSSSLSINECKSAAEADENTSSMLEINKTLLNHDQVCKIYLAIIS